MAEALGAVAGVLNVAGFAWASAKMLHELVSGYNDAPQTLRNLSRDVMTTIVLLESLSKYLKAKNDFDLSKQRQETLKALHGPLQSTKKACDELSTRVKSILSRSSDERILERDRLDLMFHDRNVNLLKAELAKCQLTLNAAVGYVTLRSTSYNHEEVQKHQGETTAALSDIKGQIQGLQVALQYLGLSDGVMIRNESADQFVTRDEAAQALKVLNEHDRVLKECLKCVTKAYEGFETESNSGPTVLNAQSLDDAKQFIGYIGDVKASPRIKIDRLTAKDRAKQFVGKMDHKAAADFWR